MYQPLQQPYTAIIQSSVLLKRAMNERITHWLTVAHSHSQSEQILQRLRVFQWSSSNDSKSQSLASDSKQFSSSKLGCSSAYCTLSHWNSGMKPLESTHRVITALTQLLGDSEPVPAAVHLRGRGGKEQAKNKTWKILFVSGWRRDTTAAIVHLIITRSINTQVKASAR